METTFATFWTYSQRAWRLGTYISASLLYVLFKKDLQIWDEAVYPEDYDDGQQHRRQSRRVGRKHKIKDTIEDSLLKSQGRKDRRELNKNLNLDNKPCKCGSNEHRSARSKDCPLYKKTKQELQKDALGSSREQFVLKMPFDSLVRPQFKELLKHKTIDMCSHIREIVIRVQIFVNHYIIHCVEHQQNVPGYVYSQSFFYSIAQLIMGISISNTNNNMPSDVPAVWNQFVSNFPDSKYQQKLTGYSNALSYECKRMEATYSNHIVENFELYIAKYFRVLMLMSDTNLRAHQVDSIISHFLWPQLLNQNYEWPESSVSAVTLSTANVISKFIETLFPLIPRPCDNTNLSKAPGDYVLALAHVSNEFQLIREERTVAGYLAGLSLDEKEHLQMILKGVPQQFAVFPIPSVKWRHISLNAKALSALSGYSTTSGHQNESAIFNHFFKMEEKGFTRVTAKRMFANVITTDAYSISIHFVRKKPEPLVLAKTLQVDDWAISEIEEFFRPCAVDPGVGTLETAAYGYGGQEHEIRTFSNKEYYSLTGSKQRNARTNKEKVITGIAVIESKQPSARAVDKTAYLKYVGYFFQNWTSLRHFYSFRLAKDNFSNYQGRQRATEEAANILINGGRKYDKKRRKRCGSKHKQKMKRKKRPKQKGKDNQIRHDECVAQPRRWRKSVVDVDNQGKMPFIVFGNGMMNQKMAFKRHNVAPTKKIYNTLKRRERLGQAVVCLIDEYYTSQVCHACHRRPLEKWKTPQGQKLHGILDCKNCGMLWNRDINAAKNMLWITNSIWDGRGRPTCFQRNPPTSP